MIDFILNVILVSVFASLICMGIYNTCKDGKIFGFMSRSLNAVEQEKKEFEDKLYNITHVMGDKLSNFTEEDQGIVKLQISVYKEEILSRTIWIWICKPLFSCPPCMASVWGSVISYFYLKNFEHSEYPIVEWVSIMLVTCAFNSIISLIQTKLDA
jgi:hypothetical protein